MSDAICPSEKEVNGWKIAMVLANTLLIILVAISTAHYNSSSCIEDSLQAIQVTFAEHLGEHKGITDRIEKLEAKVIGSVNDR